VPLLRVKELDQLPPLILRFCLRLDQFSYDFEHVASTELFTADTLFMKALIQIQALADITELQLQHLEVNDQSSSQAVTMCFPKIKFENFSHAQHATNASFSIWAY